MQLGGKRGKWTVSFGSTLFNLEYGGNRVYCCG